MYDNVLSSFGQASSVDLTVLWLRIIATGVSLTLLVIITAFALTHHGDRDRHATIAKCFALANLFAMLYVGADTAVRVDALLGDLSATLPKVRMALATVVLAIAAYINLYLALAARGSLPWRWMATLYGISALLAGILWIDHPALVIASEQMTQKGMSVFPDYGALAPWFFGLALVLASSVFVILLRSPLRNVDRGGWWLNLVGFSALFAAGFHDALRELGVFLLPVSTLSLGFTCFQVGAFAFLSWHYARTLREGRQQRVALQRMSDQLDRDHATGLYSKPYLQKLLDGRQGSEAATGGLLFVDLDDFKAVNDRHGHLFGDTVIAGVATALRTELRGQDVPCRWGGDEFLIYLPDIGPDQVAGLASRLTLQVESMQFDEVPGFRIGISMGYARLAGGNWRAGVASADRAMYVSKRNGRNQLTIAADGEPPLAVDSPD
ncbi:MAG: GGDEF domain-containing protein [Aquisalimonadaceae bacterium]